MPGRGTTIRVGVLTGRREIRGFFHGIFHTPAGDALTGPFQLTAMPTTSLAGAGLSPLPDTNDLPPAGDGGEVLLRTRQGRRCVPLGECRFHPRSDASFSLADVTIGVNFHWERREEQTFQGSLELHQDDDGSLTAVNELDIEDYLASVISSEMAATAPPEFLKAHAVMSRSWLLAMLARRNIVAPEAEDAAGSRSKGREEEFPGEIIRWYGREEHHRFDVCADDHCQRYQGVTKIVSPEVRRAIDATRGMVLVFGGRVCDARYHKACGGRTEDFATAWEDVPVPYLTSVPDGPGEFPPVPGESDAAAWIASSPEVYCNTGDLDALRQVLPAFDRETPDFFRWQVSYDRTELEVLLLKKSGIDFGELHALNPLTRGPSGRIVRLEIVGSRHTVIVGKELEIRRWLSPSHLYSSAFIVMTERDNRGSPRRFILRGAGWGHGVGLCQIGAAMMARRGFAMEDILGHYFPGATLMKKEEL